MKLGLFSGTLFSILLLLATVFISTSFADSNTIPCVPFAQKDVPDETKPEWKPDGKYPMAAVAENFQLEVIGYRSYFETESGLSMGVYEYFGEIGFKTWDCRNSIGKIGGDPEDYTIAIFIDGHWYQTYTGQVGVYVLRSNLAITGVGISVKDKNGSPLFKKVILKPGIQ